MVWGASGEPARSPDHQAPGGGVPNHRPPAGTNKRRETIMEMEFEKIRSVEDARKFQERIATEFKSYFRKPTLEIEADGATYHYAYLNKFRTIRYVDGSIMEGRKR